MATSADVAAAGLPASGRASGFTRFGWAVLGWNILVVLWGALVRATGSGAGCGSHWPLCNGEVVPPSPTTQTLIEFTHRLTSGLALIGVLLLLIWAFRVFPRGHMARTAALWSMVLILVEAALGAGLVLFRLVAGNASIARAIYLAAHLANTMVLLGALAATAWFSSARLRIARPQPLPWTMAGVLPAVLLVSISGAVAALGDTLFPASSLTEGVRQELSATAHVLLRLRLLHPALAIAGSLWVVLALVPLLERGTAPPLRRVALAALILAGVQMGLGGINVLLLAPVWMQLVHLLSADLLWITLVLAVLEHKYAA